MLFVGRSSVLVVRFRCALFVACALWLGSCSLCVVGYALFVVFECVCVVCYVLMVARVSLYVT